MKHLIVVASLISLGGGAGVAQYMGPSPTVPFRSEAAIDTATLDRLLTLTEPAKVLQADDVFTVQVYGVKDFNIQRRVAADGTVSLPLIGVVSIRGLTVEQVERQIADQLRTGGFVQDPQVSVTIVSQPSLTVTIVGEVVNPGTFSALGRHTLGDYLAKAGGLKETASPTVTLIRPSLSSPIRVPLGPDPNFSRYGEILIFPSDEIRVGKVGTFYVVGAFKNQGAYPLKNTTPTTVMNAIALGGGIGYEAASRDAKIFRTSDGRRIELNVNVSDVMKGRAEDISLRADDILFVPTDKMKAAIKGGGASLAVALASAYIYSRP